MFNADGSSYVIDSDFCGRVKTRRPYELVALQQRHALDVRGLREHVDRPHRAQAVAPVVAIWRALGASVVGLHET